MTETERVLTGAAARAVLDDPGSRVPPLPADAGTGGVDWLRANVSRFSNGAEHRRRRALVVAELARIDPAELRSGATRAALPAAPVPLAGPPAELVDELAHALPVRLLAAALGCPEASPADVGEVARVYLSPVAGSADLPAADAAVDRLIRDCGGAADEHGAARICLLVQASAATAGLIRAALPRLADGETGVAEALAAALRERPPARRTWRITASGERVAVDLRAAGEPLAFGSGPRACPAREHALALAAGVLDAVRPGGPAAGDR